MMDLETFLPSKRVSFPPCSCGESWALHVKAAAVQPRLVTRGQENAEKPQPLAGGHRVGALGHPSDPKTPRSDC